MVRFTGVLGTLTVLGLAYAFSANRQAIRYKTVASGLGLQISFAFLIIPQADSSGPRRSARDR
jgi:CNT family concentrative nucleoside transporter